MADTELKNFTPAAAWTPTCSVVGSDSASPTGSFSWTKAKFDLVYGQLAADQTWTGANTFSKAINVQSADVTKGILFGANTMLSAPGDEEIHMTRGSGGSVRVAMGSLGLRSWGTGFIGFSTGDAGGAFVAAFAKAADGVMEVNDGTAGTGHGAAINFPRTAADADAPAPASGATLYSKQVVGKNALFVRFPTGIPIQLSIEL